MKEEWPIMFSLLFYPLFSLVSSFSFLVQSENNYNQFELLSEIRI